MELLGRGAIIQKLTEQSSPSYNRILTPPKKTKRRINKKQKKIRATVKKWIDYQERWKVQLQKNVKKTSTSTKNTWLIYKFEYNDCQYCCAYMLVLTMGRNKVRSIIAKGSKKVIIEMIKPTICGVRKAKVGKQGSFNRNTHKVTAFKKVLRMMRRGLGNKKG